MKKEIAPNTATCIIRYCHPCRTTPGSAYQDRVYGLGMRVMNQTKQNSPVSDRKYRCTVCGEGK